MQNNLVLQRDNTVQSGMEKGILEYAVDSRRINMREYLEVLDYVYSYGKKRKDRTGTGTVSVFSPPEICLEMSDGFPIVTTKRIAWKSVATELLWFLRGETNNNWLRDRKVTIWDEWADEDGNLGPVYGAQWRRWRSHDGTEHDQIAEVIRQIRETPESRRIVVSAWNVGQLGEMALPPCHLLFQFYVDEDELSLKVIMRSADMFLGVPFNIASYGLLLEIIASITGKFPRKLILSLGDAHIYLNHFDQVETQLDRMSHLRPKLVLPPLHSLDDAVNLDVTDIKLVNYMHHPAIHGEVSK